MSLATDATRAQQRDAAVEWCRELNRLDPLSGRFAAGLIRALAERGDRAEGLAFARTHETLIRSELDADPDPEVRRLVAELKTLASPGAASQGIGATEARPPARGNEELAPSTLALAPYPAVGSRTTRGWRLPVAAAGAVALIAFLAFPGGPFRESLSRGGGPSGSVAASTSSPTAARLYEEGLRAIDRDDVKSAGQLMRAALEDDSTFAMAAYHQARLATRAGDVTPDGRPATAARRTALSLARRAPDRDRLLITADLLTDDLAPAAVAVAESLATIYPEDARAMAVVGRVLTTSGDWNGAATAYQRAIALDSVAERVGSTTCAVCRHLTALGEVYLWWDSLDAAERTANRNLRRRPETFSPLHQLAIIAARRGDSASTYHWFRRMVAAGVSDRAWKIYLDVHLEDYDTFASAIPQLLSSSSPHDWGNGAWLQLIALRNQGRLRDAMQFHRTGHLPGLPALTVQRTPDGHNAAILPFERGEPRVAARAFRVAVPVGPDWAPGHVARGMAWQGTLTGMALAAASDTAAVRAMADSVERWGSGSLYGRDRRAHHYLRGILHSAVGRHEDAIADFDSAIHSPSLGFTRVNYEMARSFLALGRAPEAVHVLQAALRGEIDASNLYVTRTELHELLARAFDLAGRPDSAAVHYRAVVRAWRSADPQFHARRNAAAAWLARSTR
jgi:tetratricopeptide (TPR) repeat protein